MIRNSLYFRIAAVYVLIVSISAVGAFYYLTVTYKDRIVELMDEQMESYANDIVSIYQMFDPAQADLYVKNKRSNQNFAISVFDSKARLMEYGNADKTLTTLVGSGDIENILRGQIYRNVNFPEGIAEMGLPFTMNGQNYALIISLLDDEWKDFGRTIIIQDIGVMLLIGSLFIVIAATYVVRPIKGMKAATERIARGEFDIELKWTKRTDEIGELARSFDHMAREVKQMEEMRQSFVSNVSHEIQSPLTSISGFSKTLQRTDLPEETKQRYLRIIHAESERLSRLSDSLLQLASLESEHHPFEPVRYQLSEQIREVVLAFEPQWAAKHLEVRLQVQEGVMVYADADQLSQVWTNIIGNSIKFTPDGGKIVITAKENGERIDVTVSDTGSGIRPEERERIFERFYKADQSRDKKVPGSGLGLAIVKKIVTLHGGTVQAKPRQKGGTDVTVSLPAHSKAIKEQRKKGQSV